MKRLIFTMIIVNLCLSGCFDKNDIEDVSLSLLVGIDLDDQNNLIISSSSPVFNKEAKMKEEFFESRAKSLRQSREQEDKTFIALTSRGKTQVILVGKKVMEHKHWDKILDPILRDPKNTANAKVVRVDGKAAEIVRFKPKDKPRLPIYLKKLIETTSERNITINTTVQDLRRITDDKAMTASITNMHKNKKILIVGTALLNQQGEYKISIGPDENKLLNILQKNNKGQFLFTFKAFNHNKNNIFSSKSYSFFAQKVSVKVKPSYVTDRFDYRINVKMRAVLTERLFEVNGKRDEKRFKEDIEKQLEKRFNHFIKKFQKEKIDPVGLGHYARAYEYEHWKKSSEHWGDELAKANIKIKVDVTIASEGATK